MSKLIALLSVFMIALSVTAPSLARERVEPPAEPATDLSARAATGIFGTSEDHVGGLVGAEVLVRRGWVVVGGMTALSAALFEFRDVAVGPELGIALRLPHWARVEVLGFGGARHYSRFGRDFLFGDNPGVSGTLPFVGLQTHLGVELGKPQARFSLGLRSFVDTDLGRLSKTHTYEETGWFTNGTSDVTKTDRIGLARAGLTLAIGGSFGL
jgi:hypothetical protein